MPPIDPRTRSAMLSGDYPGSYPAVPIPRVLPVSTLSQGAAPLPVSPAPEGVGLVASLLGWLDRNAFFQRNKRVPNIGFNYLTQCTSVFGVVAFNTGGFANLIIPAAGQADAPFGFLRFQVYSILTRVELSISVRGNTNNAFIGGLIFKNPQVLPAPVDFTGRNDVILSNITKSTATDISKNFQFGAYQGLRFEPGETIGLGVVGDNTGICGININYHWIASEGDIVQPTKPR